MFETTVIRLNEHSGKKGKFDANFQLHSAQVMLPVSRTELLLNYNTGTSRWRPLASALH